MALKKKKFLNLKSGEIAMGVVGGIAVVLSVVIIMAYRNYRYEQELGPML
jgi:hypothetical protein